MTGMERQLDISNRFTDADAFYAALAASLDAAGDDGAVALLSRLVLILANQIGEHAVLMEALTLAAAPTTRPPGVRG